MEENRKSSGSPQSTADKAAPQPSERSTPPFDEANRQVTNAPAPPSANEKGELVVDPYEDIDRARSVSPKLPDVNRISVFGSDFFVTPMEEPQDPMKQDQPKAPEPPATEVFSGKSVAAEQPENATTLPANVPSISQDFVESQSRQGGQPPVNLVSQAPILSPVPDPRSIPPLRTPSPHSKGIAPPEIHNAATLQVAGTPLPSMTPDITPTEPLQPRRPDYSPSDFQPPPVQREPTLSTATSSPVKENDMLSDEIMRTLSPVATAPTPSPLGENVSLLAPGNRGDTRNSSYTLSDYDSYWDDATGKPGSEERKDEEPAATTVQSAVPGSQAPVPPTEIPSSNVPALAPSSGPNEAPSQAQPDLRRRFSWEAGFNPAPPAPPADEPTAEGIPGINTPSSLGQSDIQSSKDVVSDITSPTVETPRIVIPPSSGGISQQVSMSSMAPPSQLPSMLEPPSPVSTRTDESTTHPPENRRPSLLDDKMLAEIPSHPVSMTPPPDERPTTSTSAAPPGQLPQVMGIKEIMGLPTPAQRIAKYEESRIAFAVAESGLENWLLSMKNQHPEYANATSSFSGASHQTFSQGAPPTSSSGPNPTTQQPYYQQYLNASTPTTSAPSSSRSRLGGLPISTQAASSAFGNSSNQIGTKSKEFMHSAGKITGKFSKGLLSKGKSKLRGTGDKVFH